MISATADVRSIDNFVQDYICSLSVYSPVDPSVCRPIEIPDVPLLTSSANTLSKLTKRTTTIYASGCNYTARLTLRYHHRAFSKAHAFSYHEISRRKSRQRRIIYTLSIRLVNKSNYLRVYFDQSIAHRRADEIKIIDSFYPKYLLQNLLKHLIIEIFFQ